MVVFKDKIKGLLQRRNIRQDEFAPMIGVSVSTLKKQIRYNNLPVQTLDRICSELLVSPALFFEYDFTSVDKVEQSQAEYHAVRRQQDNLQSCQEQLKAKDEIITLLKDKIALLEQN